tara:strand:+ start:646 stop:906 length:261 start_codon:yes stop_codon:yes gene_type:complete
MFSISLSILYAPSITPQIITIASNPAKTNSSKISFIILKNPSICLVYQTNIMPQVKTIIIRIKKSVLEKTLVILKNPFSILCRITH